MKKSILILMCGMLLAGVLPARGEDAVITKGSKVKLNYTLTVDGQVVDTSEGKAPLEFTEGQGTLIPGFEKGLEGLKAGETKMITVPAAEGYGSYDDTRIAEVPKTALGEGVAPEPGMVLQMQTKTGQPLAGVVVEVKDESLILDFNHPLAGKDLTFNVSILSVE